MTSYDHRQLDHRQHVFRRLETAKHESRVAAKMFGENSDTKEIASVLDGTSNTVAVVETTHRCANGYPPAWGMRGAG